MRRASGGGQPYRGCGNTVGFFDRDNVSYIYTVETYSRISEEVLEKVRRQIEEDPSRLEDKDYLDEIASDLKDKSSYIIIRKNDMLSYTSNSGDAKKFFPHCRNMGMRCRDQRLDTITVISGSL